MRADSPSEDGGTWRLSARAVSYFRPERGLILLLLVLVALSIGLGLLQAWPLAILIDSVLTDQPRQDFFHRLFLAPLPSDTAGRIIGVALIGMAMKILQDGLTWARTILNNRINNWGVARLREELYEKVSRPDGEKSNDGEPGPRLGPGPAAVDGDTMYRMVNDAQGPQVVLNVLLGALVSAATFLATAAVMLSRSVALTLYALSVTPALLLLNLKFGHVLRDRTTAAKEREAHMVSLMSGPSDRPAFGASALDVARTWLGLNRAQELYWFLVRTVFSLGGAVIFGYGGYLAWQQQFAHPVPGGMTVGTLAVFMDYLGRLWDPLTRLTGAAADIQPGIAGARRVFEVLDRVESTEAAGRGGRVPRSELG